MAKCPVCGIYKDAKREIIRHMEKMHIAQIPENMSTLKYYYALNHNGQITGKCRVCSNPTDFDEATGRTKVLCNNPKCKEVFAKNAQQNNISKLGIAFPTRLQDHQMKMLAARKISGTYNWSDGRGAVSYVGSYERRFLQFVDLFLDFDPATIYSPCPITIPYEYEGETLLHTPDFYIDILDLIIEIKHGGENPNMHPKIQAVDVAKDKAKEEAIKKYTEHNYIKIVDNKFGPFLELLVKLTDQRIENTKTRLIMINESTQTVEGPIHYMLDTRETYFILYGEPNDLQIAVAFNPSLIDVIVYDDGKFRFMSDEDRKTCLSQTDTNKVVLYRYVDGCLKGGMTLVDYTYRGVEVDEISSYNAFAKIFSTIFDAKENYTPLDYVTNPYLERYACVDKKSLTERFYTELKKLLNDGAIPERSLGQAIASGDNVAIDVSDDGDTAKMVLKEVSVHNKLDSNFVKKDMNTVLSSLTHIPLNNEVINRYRQAIKSLSHIRIGDDYTGYFYTYKSIPVGYINVNNKNHTIQAMEIFKDFKGFGLSKVLLDDAVRKLKGDNLTVNKANELAINIYKKYGFSQYKLDGNTVFMKLPSSRIETEANDIKYIFYGLTAKEAENKIIDYKYNKEYNGKGVNTSLSGLIRFLKDNKMQDDVTHYAKIPISKFEIVNDILPDKKYDMIVVKTPFKIEIDSIHKLDYNLKEE